jgi:hypothetical protein
MSEIFLSYAREDRSIAAQLAGALQARGWSVWWDREIATGKPFDEAIEDALFGAHCVIVLWSAASVASDWVKSEASEGRARGILLPVLIEEVTPPLEFRRIQAVRLIDWGAASPHPEFDRLVDDVARVLNRAPLPIPPNSPRKRFAYVLLMLPSLLTVLLLVAAVQWRVPTAVRVELNIDRAKFVLAAGDAPLTRIFDAIAFESVTVERFATVSLEPRRVEVADPAGYDLARDRYPDSAWRNVLIPETTTVEFRALDAMRLPSVTLERFPNEAGALGNLRPISVPIRSEVTLAAIGDRARTITLTLVHAAPVLSLPVPERFQLSANQTAISGMPGLRHAEGDPLTLRFELREGHRPAEVKGRPEGVVVSLRLASELPATPILLFSEGAIPISAIDFSRQDELGNRVSALVGEGRIGFLEDPQAASHSLRASDVVLLADLERFHIRRITVDPGRKGLQLQMDGRAGVVTTRSGNAKRDHRLTAFDVLKRRPTLLAIALAVWLVPTAIAGYRLRPGIERLREARR